MKRTLVLALAALGLLLAVSAAAAPGDLDPGFGKGGFVTTSFGSAGGQATAVALQQDGKIVATFVYGRDFALARYQANGSLDTSFGSGGKVTTPMAELATSVDVALQPDGKIVAAGSSYSGNQFVFALARYNPDGSLDSSFGSGGTTTAAFGSDNAYAYSLALQADGKIVLAGEAAPQNSDLYNFALARLNADGTLDHSFGTAGEVITPFGAGWSFGYAVAVQPNGKIVVGGSRHDSEQGPFEIALARYRADGSLDTSFGSGGRVTTNTVADAGANALALQPDGKLLAGGSSGGEATLARYRADGTLDSTFGSDGLVTTQLGSDDSVTGLALQQDGKIVAAGTTQQALDAPNAFFLARYLPDGRPDLHFAQLGRAEAEFGDNFDSFANDLAIQPDGKFVVVGGADKDGSDMASIALARYLNQQPLCAVPKVRGDRLARAKRLIRRSHCSLGTIKRKHSRSVQKGHVISQHPRPGRHLVAGTAVSLTVSKGKR